MNIDEIKKTIDSICADFNLVDYVNELDIGAYIVNKNRVILHWNKKAEEITGYKSEDVIGRSCSANILCHKDRSGIEICPTDLCPLYRTIKTGKTAEIPFALYLKTKTGSRLPVDIFSFPLIVKGEIKGGIEFFSKVTEKHMDLERSLKIQSALIPRNLPDNIQIFLHTADVVGGDMIYYKSPWLVLTDVSGHGISSALVSTAVRIMLDEVLCATCDIADIGDILEEKYQNLGIDDLFFTATFIKIDGNKLQIKSFANPHPIIISERTARFLPIESDFPLGVKLEHQKSYAEYELRKGESLFIHSDGLYDIKTKNGIIKDDLFAILVRHSKLPDIYIYPQ